MASVGVEPTTFALLARRSNRLSYPAVALVCLPFGYLKKMGRVDFKNIALGES